MKNNRNLTIYFPLLLAFFLVAGMYIGTRMQPAGKKQPLFYYPRQDKLNAILNYIDSDYVDSVNRGNLVEAAIPAILKELDPHSIYIPASELQAVNEPLEGNFEGIGVSFNMPDDTVVIISTVPDGPSAKVGILAGDRIVTINDSIVAGIRMPQEMIVSRLKGPRGTLVQVGIKRPRVKEVLKFNITRDRIPLYSVDVAYMADPEIGYIKISKFARTTHDEFVEAVNNLKSAGMKKLIIDLRGNNGGYMDAATRIADEFLDKGKLIVYTEGRARSRAEVRATTGGLLLHEDLVIIIDEWSASASEILAGAIQDNDRGTILGRRSYGKGLVQEPRVFSDGSAIRLTIARYYTPTGRSIQKSYTHGSDEYFNDISTRFDNGEFMNRDSIQFLDTVKYITPAGKVVYGGGGIMPDVFVPIDTSGISAYFMEVRNRGLIYRFAFEYTDRQRSALSGLSNAEEFDKYLGSEQIYRKFVLYSENAGVRGSFQDRNLSRELIEVQIKAYIARNILDNVGFYPLFHRIDHTFQESLRLLRQE